MYAVPVHPRCVSGLQVLLAAFVLPIVVRDGDMSLLKMTEETPFDLVPPLEVAQGLNTWAVVLCLF